MVGPMGTVGTVGRVAETPVTTHNGRDCKPSPASAGQYLAATGQVAAMTSEFFSGLGPGDLTFGPESSISQVMAQSGPVQDVLNSYFMTGQTSGLYTFGGSGLVAAGGNPVAQFVGSFRWNIAPGDGGINLSLTNTTSLKSLTYDLGLSGNVAPSPLGWEILIRHTTSLAHVNDHETTISVGIANVGALCSGRLPYDAAPGHNTGRCRKLRVRLERPRKPVDGSQSEPSGSTIGWNVRPR
jgi:hypothetical protein